MYPPKKTEPPPEKKLTSKRVQPTRGWTVAAQRTTNCTHSSCPPQWGPVSTQKRTPPNNQGGVGRQQQKKINLPPTRKSRTP